MLHFDQIINKTKGVAFPDCIMIRTDLTSATKILYCTLLQAYYNNEGPFEAKIEDLCSFTALNRITVMRSIKSLVNLKLIEKKSRGRLPTIYSILEN